MTKQEQATQIVASNAGKARKEIIELIRTELGMTDAGASTYYYNATKKLASIVKTSEVNEELAQAAPKKLEVASDEPTSEHWSSEWVKRQKVLRNQLDENLSKIDINDIPLFLRK